MRFFKTTEKLKLNVSFRFNFQFLSCHNTAKPQSHSVYLSNFHTNCLITPNIRYNRPEIIISVCYVGLNFRQFSLVPLADTFTHHKEETLCIPCFSLIVRVSFFCAPGRFFSQKKSLVKVRKTSMIGLNNVLVGSITDGDGLKLPVKNSHRQKKNNNLRCPYKYASTAATRTAGGNLAALSAVMTPPPSPSTSRCESQLSSTYSNVNPVFLNMSTPDLSGVNIYC